MTTSALRLALKMRPISAADNPHIAQEIRAVSAEFGLTADKGYTVADPQLDNLYKLYSAEQSAYWIVEHEGKVVGGGGRRQASRRSPAARPISMSCRRCISCLTRAIKLYESLGFECIESAPGCTGHGDCEYRMLKML
ncbi:acetyltransferase|nr:acetyltransferase [Candidatus Pantoea persica]